MTLSDRDASRPDWPTARKWERMGEVERLRFALAFLADAVEHEHRPERLPSVRVGQGVRFAREALAVASADYEVNK